MSHPFLPKRKSGTENQFALPTSPGKWEERPHTHLEQLASAIEIPPTNSKIYSVPDPWARAILFDRALFDDTHALHQTTLGEWRGALALIGLKERRGMDGMSVTKVDLKQMGQVQGSFASVLERLMPQDNDRLAVDSDWQQFYLMRWKLYDHLRARAFAITSPLTLVCAGADYAGVLPTSIPWYDGRVLSDPTSHLSNRERVALAEWLRVLVQKISVGANSQRRGWVIDHLKQFAGELAKVPEPNEKDVLSDRSLGFSHGVYRVLDRPRRKETGTVTDVAIVPTVTSAPTYLLIDPAMEHQLNEQAREIVVYGDISLALSDSFTRSGKTSDIITPGINWCTPDFFFTETLVYEAEGTGAFPGCMKVEFSGDPRKRSIMLPLSADALRLFTPRSLAQSFRVDWQPDGSAVCRLQLTLRSSQGLERPYTIQKIYTDDDMERIGHLPMVCIWPDFRLDSWKTYFLFQMWFGTQDELSVRPWSAAEPDPEPARRLNLENSRFQVYRTTRHPEVLICETPFYSRKRQREWSAPGLLLLELPPLRPPSEQSPVLLGIDFGSTGTNVYQCIDGQKPEPVLFKSRIQQVTDADPAHFKLFSRDLFLPAVERLAKNILSVYHDFGDPDGGENDRMVLRDGHILYLDDPGEFDPKERNRVKSNLKWGGERERLVAKDFLKQLCLQAAAEMVVQGVRTVDLRFSYPTAFSAEDLQRFRVNWNLIPNTIKQYSGLQITVNDRKVDNCEAMAATRFFSEHTGNADITGGAITIDIGGGTTDLALWNNLELYSHSSIRFAGRDIFLAPLRKKPGLLQEIEPRIRLDRLQKGQQDAAFNAHLDAIVARHGDDLISVLPIKEARPNVRGFLRLLETGLCGVGFYAGLMVRRAVEKKLIDKSGIESISVFAGGNGCKIFEWCALGEFSDESPIHDQFSKALQSGADWPGLRIHIERSLYPKAEVAFGLVSSPLRLDKREDFAADMSGEQFRIGKDDAGKRTWDQAPTWSDIKARSIAVDRELPVFRQFLDSIDVTLNSGALDKIRGSIDLAYKKEASDIEQQMSKDRNLKGENLLRKEPIFILALKKFLEMEMEEWASGV
jgi:hypothetical protein